MLCMVECTRCDTECPDIDTESFGSIASENLLQLVYYLVFKIGALIWVQGLWWAENINYSFDDGPGYCAGRLVTYRQQRCKNCQIAHHRENTLTLDPCG